VFILRPYRKININSITIAIHCSQTFIQRYIVYSELSESSLYTPQINVQNVVRGSEHIDTRINEHVRGCDVIQAVISRVLSPEDRIRIHGSPCGICTAQSGTRTRSSLSSSFPLSLSFHRCRRLYLLTYYLGAGVGQRAR
jgi:hypothetical protein